MQLYREWTEHPYSRKGLMLPVAEIKKYLKWKQSGYTSLYMFGGDAADALRNSGSSKGMGAFKTYARDLVIDCDKGDDGLREILTRLDAKQYEYSIWRSGGKGYHIYLPMDEEMYAKFTPYSQKRWVVDEKLDTWADMSLYRADRLLSAPGRIHAKTGKRKEFIEFSPGRKITVKYREPETLPFTDIGDVSDKGLLAMAALKYADITDQPQEGYRFQCLWSCAQMFRDAGISRDCTEELMVKVNSLWENGHDESEVMRALQEAYK
jgi:hypothetical protein